jgi:phosphate transport system substrate-binding protein
LAEIYGEDGKITRWQQLGVDNTACPSGQIVRISRQNSSGTYAYFKEAVLGKKREYKQGYTAQSGSSDLVALISKTPCAIGYSGMGYRNETVTVLNVAKAKGEPAVEPTIETAQDGSYPIARPLYLYTLGEPSGAIQEFIQWILSDEGQRIVELQGYIPVRSTTAAAGSAAGD